MLVVIQGMLILLALATLLKTTLLRAYGECINNDLFNVLMEFIYQYLCTNTVYRRKKWSRPLPAACI